MEQKPIEMQSNSKHPTTSIPITFRFFSTLRNSAGTGEVTLTVQKGETLKNALKSVEVQYLKPNNTAVLNDTENQLEIGVICLINDVDVNLAGGLSKKLNNPCTITLISSLHGG
ncbi:MAG: hypothetical protein DRO88_07475 [Promethearchaeia archaeon]|nr:MAG: hypothetical protein DRO88_07475 [Candidatus Lokiarchaeia archaeon]